jgi:DNA-binding NarL/FixJ family response regulator
MISAVAPLVRGSTYRRGVYLLLGGVILLPYALLAVVFVRTLTTPAGARGVTVPLLAATLAIAGVPAFLQGTRALEIVAVRGLLGVDLPDPPRVLVVTTFENDDYVDDALRAGASGFLLKRARPAEVVEAIRVVAGGESLLFPAAIRRLVAGHGAARGGDQLEGAGLTDREADVLRLMAAGRSNAEIAAELVVGVETVKTHVGNVLTKLGARDRTQAVIAAYESGFIAPSR